MNKKCPISTTESHFKKIEFCSFFLLALAGVFGILFFVGLYPGRLVRDTIGNIYNALNGTYSLIYPPFIEAFLGMVFVFDKSLFSIFFLQIFTYWAGVYLIAIYFYHNKSLWLSFFVFIVALFPYNIYLHSTLIKDVWLQVTYILFFGLLCNSAHKKISINLLCITFLTGLIVILLRNVFIALIPPIALCISWLLLQPKWQKEYWVKLSILTVLFSVVLWGLGTLFNTTVTNGKIKNIDNFASLASFDLIGMSIRSGHMGVTKELSTESKSKTTNTYYGVNIFWRGKVGNEAVELRRRLRSSPDIKRRWKKEIQQNPFLYLQHRLHVFSKLFNGTGQSHTTMLKKNLNLGPKRFRERLESLNVQAINPTAVWQIYQKQLIWYFSKIKSNWWILFLSCGMGIIASIYTISSKTLNKNLSICMLMNLCAWSYFGPYVFMMGHSEVRHVYPGLSLILFSLPFFLSFLKNAISNFSNNKRNAVQ